jgi:hypothetical protein
MAGNRTLKLSILADVDDLKKKLGDGNQEVEGFGAKVSEFGKKAGAAFAIAAAAAAAYAGKLLIDGVKAAIEDEKAQTALALSLRNVAGASDAVIANTEKYILKTSLATGVTDDQLRPSLDRLVRSTKDVEAAQKLQTLALDISAGSGKSLEAVTAALGRAYDGNTAGLSRLGVGLSAAELKSLTFDEVTKTLAATFGGQATEQAETFAGKMDRLNIAIDEGKETAGSFILDAITPLVTLIVDKGIPAIAAFADEVGPKLTPIIQAIASFVKDTLFPAFKNYYDLLNATIIPFIRDVVIGIFNGLKNAFDKISKAVKDNKDEFKDFYNTIRPIVTFIVEKAGPVFKTVFSAAISALGSAISGVITGFGKLAGFIADVVNGIKAIISLVKNNPIVQGIGGLIDRVFGGGKAAGGFVSPSKSYLVGEKGPELFVPGTPGNIIPNNKMSGGGMVINLNVSGAIDPEGTARTIIQTLNDSFNRGTLGALAFRS